MSSQDRIRQTTTTKYRCRRCSAEHSGPSGLRRVIRDCFATLVAHPYDVAEPGWSAEQLKVGMFAMHHCEDGGLGISDLIGANPDE